MPVYQLNTDLPLFPPVEEAEATEDPEEAAEPTQAQIKEQ